MLLDPEKRRVHARTRRRLGLACALGCLAALTLAAPASAFPTNVGAPELSRSGRTLSTTNGSWLLADSFSYAWQRCNASVCLPVSGRTGPTYLLTTADINWRIRSVVTATNALGSTAAPSEPTATIMAAPPVNQVPPAVSGTLRHGNSLTSTLGTWSDPSPANVSYARRWQRCTMGSGSLSCQTIAGATGAGYQLGAEDVDKFMRVVVTAEGLGAASEESPPAGPVAALPGTSGGGGSGEGTTFGGGGTGTTPGSTTGPPRLRPFPVIVLAGRISRGLTLITRLVVRGPRGATASVRCRGRGCPRGGFRRRIGRSRRMRLRRYERIYGAGAIIEIRVTGRGRVGKYTRFRTHATRPPSRRDACLFPGSSRPRRCR